MRTTDKNHPVFAYLLDCIPTPEQGGDKQRPAGQGEKFKAMKKQYTIKITGSGTAEQITQRLYESAARLYNAVHTIHRKEPLDIEMESEDDILYIEIKED